MAFPDSLEHPAEVNYPEDACPEFLAGGTRPNNVRFG